MNIKDELIRMTIISLLIIAPFVMCIIVFFIIDSNNPHKREKERLKRLNERLDVIEQKLDENSHLL